MSEPEKKKKKKKTTRVCSSNPYESRFHDPNGEHRIILGDCYDMMDKVAKGSVNLAFADPDFNSLRPSVTGESRQLMDPLEYLQFLTARLKKAERLLASDGSMFVVANDDFVSELDVFCKSQLHLVKMHHIPWCQPFGTSIPRHYTKSHVFLLHYVKDKKHYTFVEGDKSVRIQSQRQRIKDKRANPDGKMPDDNWTIGGHDLQDAVGWRADVWYADRVCGTHADRIQDASTQMPRSLLERIIKIHTYGNNLVLDLFAGTFQMAAIAASLGRQTISIEIDPELCIRGRERLGKVVDEIEAAKARKQNGSADRSDAGTRSSKQPK